MKCEQNVGNGWRKKNGEQTSDNRKAKQSQADILSFNISLVLNMLLFKIFTNIYDNSDAN